jgi:hypothetical protein
MDIEGDLSVTDGVVYLTLYHDKGKSVLALINGTFQFVDGGSVGAFQDLRHDIPVATA